VCPPIDAAVDIFTTNGNRTHQLKETRVSDTTWNDHYASGHLPWDTGNPEPMLTAFITAGRVAPTRMLEVGSGTGTNAIWLAERGFDVLGIDVSPLAVEAARTKLAGRAVRCRFETRDFLAEPTGGGPFDFVFDRGTFHVFDEPEQRALFAERVAAVLAPGGRWLSLIGSTEGPPREVGPPRRSARDVAAAIEPVLEIVELSMAEFADGPVPFKAWVCLAGRRATPAQPSSRRS
jgi:SAM-dependent methyltransferase